MAGDLTVKQRRFVQAYVENGGNGTQAARAAYPVSTENTAASTASTNIRNPKIKTAIVEALEKAGITSEFLARKHKRALGWIEHEEAPRAALGLKALKLAYDVRGELIQTATSQGEVTVTVAVQVLNEIETPVDTQTVTLPEPEEPPKSSE